MPDSIPAKVSTSAPSLTLAAYVSFVPIGIATVLLGPMLPVLSARWALNYSQSGALFSVQYIASTLAVGLSGVLASRWGFAFAIKTGLLLMATGLALLLAGPKSLGIACIAAYGGGLGLAVPAANLLVAAANPDRRSATLNLLNFFWSTGAVSCPVLVAAAARNHAIPLLLASVSGLALLIAIGIALMPVSIGELAATRNARQKVLPLIQCRPALFIIMGALFLVYVGTENGFGGWIASFAKSLGNVTPAISLMTPSFFHAALMLGRWVAPLALRRVGEIKLARAGLLLACAGTAGLLFSHGLSGVVASACSAGLGLACVYPITISLLSLEYGSASSLIGSFMFVLSNIGGGLFPWIIGVTASRVGTLKAGMFVPLMGCIVMYVLYQRKWSRVPIEPTAWK